MSSFHLPPSTLRVVRTGQVRLRSAAADDQQATAAIGQAIGRPELPYVPFSYEDAKKGMMGAGLSESMAGLYDEMTRSMNEERVMVSAPRDAASTTPTTLEAFAQSVFAPAFKAAVGA